MVLDKLKQILAVTEKSNPGSMVPITIKELDDLVMAAETLRMVAGDMAILKATLTVDRNRAIIRKSDLTTAQALIEMVDCSVEGLRNLGAEDIYADDVGDYVFKRLAK